jgi:hypothetical protein
MLFYLFTIEQEVKSPLPFNLELFKYEPIDKKIYYVVKIEGETVQLLDDKENIVSSGTLTKSTKTLNTNSVEFYLSCAGLTSNGGFIKIKENNCELIGMGSGLPYIFAYKGTLRKLIKKTL